MVDSLKIFHSPFNSESAIDNVFNILGREKCRTSSFVACMRKNGPMRSREGRKEGRKGEHILTLVMGVDVKHLPQFLRAHGVMDLQAIKQQHETTEQNHIRMQYLYNIYKQKFLQVSLLQVKMSITRRTWCFILHFILELDSNIQEHKYAFVRVYFRVCVCV